MGATANGPLTAGAHHIGLTVSRLEETAEFFTKLLGWQEVRRNEQYPAIFVSDGATMVSLWQASEPAQAFDRRHNTGLHHVAFKVPSREALEEIHMAVAAAGLEVEFAPELLRLGPAMHMICHEPSGVRVEFIWPGR